MDEKEKLVENLYKIAEIIILEEKSEEIKEIRLYKREKGWSATIINATEKPFTQNPMLPRQMYKNIRLKTRKKPKLVEKSRKNA